MHRQFILLITFLITYITTLNALNTTITAPIVAAAAAKPISPIVACTKQSQCAKTHFCNIKQQVCMLKYPLHHSCEKNKQCASDKCHKNICRQGCKENKHCSITKEYCTISNYCESKHCGTCTRNVECANGYCKIFRCEENACSNSLKAIKLL
ncbi:unnamed protein product [Adineta steineri]|uniref:Uncharacterized protein n=1 Tax=Adineta steineri TaxID=433720 RepID=A0A820EFU4_9BILA|nr:unnamed protein product [Adineta steineri]